MPSAITKSPLYHPIWRVVNGAISDAIRAHPEYLTPAGDRAMRVSVAKRVAGAVTGFLEQSKGGRVAPAIPADVALLGAPATDPASGAGSVPRVGETAQGGPAVVQGPPADARYFAHRHPKLQGWTVMCRRQPPPHWQGRYYSGLFRTQAHAERRAMVLNVADQIAEGARA